MENIKCSYDELVPLHKLVQHPKNPNKHPEDQIEMLAKIIDYQGMRSPIVVSNQSGFITKGHGRLAALQKLGWEQAPVNFQDYENDAQEYADITADNAIAEWASLDLSQINKDIIDLGPELDIEMLGIKDFEIEPCEVDFQDLKSGDAGELGQKTFTLHNSQIDTIDDAIKKVKEDYKDMYLSELNDNSNGNAIAFICERFVDVC